MFMSFRDVTFEWPNGQLVFQNLNFALEGARRYGLVGPNGAGKTTLVRLIAGELEATAGEIRRDGDVLFFDQLATPPDLTLGEVLAPTSVWDDPLAMRLIGAISMELLCSTLSGGQWTRVRLAIAASSGRKHIVLDEPTNNLDVDGREAVHEFIDQFAGTLLIVSHDRELLKHVDEILELSSHGLARYGGDWDFYREARDGERSRAENALRAAKNDRDTAKRERTDRLESQEKRMREGKARGLKGGMPKILLGARKRAAQISLGKVDAQSAQRRDDAVADAFEAYSALKVDPVLFATLPQPKVHAQELVMGFERFNFQFNGAPRPLWSQPLTVHVRGPRKIAIRGANGSGKSTLLRVLIGETMTGATSGEITRPRAPIAFISQKLEHLDPRLSVFDNVRATSSMDEVALRNALATFQFRGDQVFQTVETLSGGERLRAALAKALLGKITPSILILDEPTNHVDLKNTDFLENFLNAFAGAVVLVSHDQDFVKNAGIEEEIVLTSYS